MKFKLMLVATACVGFITPTSRADAQFGQLLKKGGQAVGKKLLGKTAQKATQEGAEQILKKAASVTIRKAGQESMEAFAKKAGVAVIRHSDDVVKAVGIHGSAISGPLIKHFADDGAKALVRLSPTQARRMAILSDVLASKGQGKEWMKVLAEKGDAAADWIWKNKGTIALGTTAVAFLATPDSFLQAGERVASVGIETAGAHVARPMIEQTVSTVAPQVAKQVSRAVVAPAQSVVNATTQDPTVFVIVALFIAAAAIAIYRRVARTWGKHRSDS